MNDQPSDIVITISITPAANGKRKIIISGAPEKEMPVVRTGTFPDLHRLIDETWVKLMKREPQVVTIKEKVKSAKSKVQKAHGDQLDADNEQDEVPDAAEQAIDEQAPPLTEPDDTIEQAEQDLPKIEGDTDE